MYSEQTPSWEQLIDWLEGRLSPVEAEAIEAQIAEDQEAAADLAWLSAFKRAGSQIIIDEPPRELHNALRTSFDAYVQRQSKSNNADGGLFRKLVAALSFDSGLQLGLAGARTMAFPDTRQLIYSTEVADVSLNVQVEEDRLRIDGQLLPVVDVALDQFRARLQKGELFAEEVKVDELGHFAFAAVVPGTYQLTLATNTLIVLIESVDLSIDL